MSNTVAVSDEALKTNRQEVKLFWRWHDTSETKRRVWRDTWSGDTFEVMSLGEFAALEKGDGPLLRKFIPGLTPENQDDYDVSIEEFDDEVTESDA